MVLVDTQASSQPAERTNRELAVGALSRGFVNLVWSNRILGSRYLHKSCAPDGRGVYRKELFRSRVVGARAAAAAASAAAAIVSSQQNQQREQREKERGKDTGDEVSRASR